jgi:hypothetical protein
LKGDEIMKAKTKMLIWASLLALAGMPFLYIGGQNGSSTLMILGFACFGIGMLIAPLQFLKGKSQAK